MDWSWWPNHLTFQGIRFNPLCLQVIWFLDGCHVFASCAKILAGLEFRRWCPLGFVNSCEMHIIAQNKCGWKEGSRGRKRVYGFFFLVELDSYFNLNERNWKFDFTCWQITGRNLRCLKTEMCWEEELKGIYGRRVSLVAWKWLNSEENTQHNC